MIVYVKTQGARIVKEGRHLLVKKGDGIYNTLFTYKLDQLLLFGNISCGHCVNSIQVEVSSLPGVSGVWANQETKSVEIEFDPPASEETIKELLEKINYPVAE